MASFLQQNKICHNDISLSNVMIDRQSQRILMIDFADSSLIHSKNAKASTSTAISTLSYGSTGISAPSASTNEATLAFMKVSNHSESKNQLPKRSPFLPNSVSGPKFLSLSRFQHLMIKEGDCKDGVKLERLVHNWIKKTQLSTGVQVLKRSLSECLKKKFCLNPFLNFQSSMVSHIPT
ncbi:hypothetical protein DI09_44p80 [Mitosporidium daphniae]|uniref:Uncharacterized protein n=1 Tax=Mitosporidium daphniae TaxID=1485682 RepID=A0A098VQK7_9MICR|nr:uncharacterized protein DI09_44p80 [Mitosporidium daphniae]KGG51104.1 hypothetical protein DI09_44p80 [Mitosporidium daphniae]|eukprot:XP_013237553.1 uncharacterized protein DI09_44p80 [Mitosporidium daphniae]